MFYSTQILSRKGPLGLVWIAAHIDGQLKKNQVSEMSIPGTVEVLLSPDIPLALRLTGQLLLGVVRIYSYKVTYLHQDCKEALVKIRLAFHAKQKKKAVLSDVVQSAAGAEMTSPLDDDEHLLMMVTEGVDDVEAALMMMEGNGMDPLAALSQHSDGLDDYGLHKVLEGSEGDLDMMEVDVLGLGSQAAGGSQRRQRCGSLHVEEHDRGLHREGMSQGPLGGKQNYQQEWGGPGGHVLHRPSQPLVAEDELFGPADGAIPYDLDEIEVEQLRAAPASEVLGPANAAAALAGLTGVEGLLYPDSANLQLASKRHGIRLSDADTPAAGRVVMKDRDEDGLMGTEERISPGGNSQGAEAGPAPVFSVWQHRGPAAAAAADSGSGAGSAVRPVQQQLLGAIVPGTSPPSQNAADQPMLHLEDDMMLDIQMPEFELASSGAPTPAGPNSTSGAPTPAGPHSSSAAPMLAGRHTSTHPDAHQGVSVPGSPAWQGSQHHQQGLEGSTVAEDRAVQPVPLVLSQQAINTPLECPAADLNMDGQTSQVDVLPGALVPEPANIDVIQTAPGSRKQQAVLTPLSLLPAQLPPATAAPRLPKGSPAAARAPLPPRAAGTAAASRAVRSTKVIKKPAVLDAPGSGTQLSTKEMRALLTDRSSLLRDCKVAQGSRFSRQEASRSLALGHIPANILMGCEGDMLEPSLPHAAGEALQLLYRGALGQLPSVQCLSMAAAAGSGWEIDRGRLQSSPPLSAFKGRKGRGSLQAVAPSLSPAPRDHATYDVVPRVTHDPESIGEAEREVQGQAPQAMDLHLMPVLTNEGGSMALFSLPPALPGMTLQEDGFGGISVASAKRGTTTDILNQRPRRSLPDLDMDMDMDIEPPCADHYPLQDGGMAVVYTSMTSTHGVEGTGMNLKENAPPQGADLLVVPVRLYQPELNINPGAAVRDETSPPFKKLRLNSVASEPERSPLGALSIVNQQQQQYTPDSAARQQECTPPGSAAFSKQKHYTPGSRAGSRGEIAIEGALIQDALSGRLSQAMNSAAAARVLSPLHRLSQQAGQAGHVSAPPWTTMALPSPEESPGGLGLGSQLKPSTRRPSISQDCEEGAVPSPWQGRFSIKGRASLPASCALGSSRRLMEDEPDSSNVDFLPSSSGGGSGSQSAGTAAAAGGALTQRAGTVLVRVATAAMSNLPPDILSRAAISTQGGEVPADESSQQSLNLEHVLTQEATQQLSQTSLSLSQLTGRSNRMQACRWFSELLVLKSHGLLQLSQGQPYEDLGVSVTSVGIQVVMPHLAAMAIHHSSSQQQQLK
ncbi:hypothetical protein CEUSTIGMA_g5339.t1 [Chlamydomonas eustigma]|uniref:Rad21/Rec8-like protein N-terminal domain-containing protein n=1 Tax=Chlamydomonas eustigma TaxID=1157962 RepID=A0A250X488_9CHLO|nr:hypothetical protein CEUSTIGMA_g5339.t1 [Chlamydomonas eustigma]|eukprot:GAX77897.1 hypothetical protein CEUSTIGMA_g5339.t1 [Chlamydomonas eustigma]